MEKQKDIEKLSEVMELQELPLEYTGITLNNQDIDLMMIANSETFDDLRERLERITNIKTTINPNASIEDERQRVFDLYMQSLIPKVEYLKTTELPLKIDLRLSKKIEYLKQSGRLPNVLSFVGNMLSIKPICTMQDGKSKIVSKVRGTKQIASKLVDMILELNGGNLEDKILTIGYGSNEADFKKLQEEVSKKIKAKKIYITRGGSCICSHTGPEILAISSSY